MIVAYRMKMSRIASWATVMNPPSGKMEDRLLINSNNSNRTILLQNHEVQSCINVYFTKYKGVGARNLHKRICSYFCGVSEREIQAFINRQQIS